MDIRSYMAAVPEQDRFLTVDELHAGQDRIAAEFPEVASLRRVGTSRLGEPIRMLSIGKGSHHALLFGCPHPNEPIGAMMLHHFARALCEDQELRDHHDYTWHLIPCVDPDGTRLNENWFAGPFTPRHYARNFYRPAGHEQVEWTFPFSYKRAWFDQPIPETQMLMRVIDELQPELMISLHNAGFGGVYYYLSHGDADYFSVLHQLPEWESLPLRLGEPEAPYIEEIAPAIFPMLDSRAGYDYIESNGGDPAARPHGTSSAQYAEKYGTFYLVTEMAYFDDARVNDTTVTDRNRREAILAGIDLSEEGGNALRRHYQATAKDLRGDSPFEHAVAWWIDAMGENRDTERNWARSNPDTDRPATVAELFSSDQEVQFYRLLSQGMLVRMLEGELAIGNRTPAIRAHHAEALANFNAWADRLENSLDYRVVPIRKLMSVQLGSMLATADYLAARRGGTA